MSNNIALLNHFDNAEVFSYSGNACQSDGGIFNSKCALFPDTNSFVNISNHSGLFNLSPGNSCEFEFFIRPDNIYRINSAQEQEMYNAGFRWFNGHSFLLYQAPLTWDNAKAACEARGGHLAVIDSNEKYAFINSVLSGVGSVWVGGVYDHNNNSISWVDNSVSSDNSDWATGYPNSSGNYIAINSYTGSSLFVNLNNTEALYFLIEWDDDNRFHNSAYSYYIWKNSIFVHNDHYFKLFTDVRYWTDAKATCEARGGHLATSNTADKDKFLSTFLNNGGMAWMGGTDEEHEGTWTWITGEEWNYSNWAPGQPSNAGGSQPENYIFMDGAYGNKWADANNEHGLNYICEWDSIFDYLLTLNIELPVLNIGNNFALSLVSTTGHLHLSSSSWNIDSFSQNVLSSTSVEPEWYHILLRLYNQNAYLFLNGNLVISAPVSGNSITPNNVSLGGFVGKLDEFVFRNSNVKYSASVNVPTKPYGSSGDNNAPVTRAVWSCNNLPDGLTISQSGLLTGHPTKAGTYDCNFSVSTNWGTANKTLRIVIQ